MVKKKPGKKKAVKKTIAKKKKVQVKAVKKSPPKRKAVRKPLKAQAAPRKKTKKKATVASKAIKKSPSVKKVPKSDRAAKDFLILVLNPGSTSTKVAVYRGSKQLVAESIGHDKSEIEKFPRIVDQYPMRKAVVLDFLSRNKIGVRELSAVVDRGGLLKPISSGTYHINQSMLDDLKEARRGEHISNVGAFIAKEIAEQAGCRAFIVDAVSVDEFDPLARISGLAEIERKSLLHALNMRMAALQACQELKKKLAEVNLIVAHLGGGISISPLDHGKFIDVNNANEGGPFSPERAGGVPTGALVKMCFSGKYTVDEIKKKLTRSGGLSAYLGTNMANQVKDRVLAGDQQAEEVFRAMAYQIAKEIGACATALKGRVDAIVVTGGVAFNEIFTDWIKERVLFISPRFLVYPGEDEMPALAAGALRVLRGDEKAREY
ncbi:TPA: butyrate kinase [Candidatus Edwardsbacteria bacterium]|nr:butyrate kinase [Candidatus Edwardsbacteria bacterium]